MFIFELFVICSKFIIVFMTSHFDGFYVFEWYFENGFKFFEDDYNF
jgi:hypothetical protein